MRHIRQFEKEFQGMDGDEDMHSEKIRRLLSEMPRSLTVWGSIVIAVVFIGIVLALCLLPYPHSGGESILVHLLRKY